MKGIKIALIFFIVMFIGDLISTLINGSLVQHLEANPLYHHLGVAGIAVLNVGVAVVFYYGYFYSKRAETRHAFLYSLVLVSVIRVFVIYNNVMVFQNPPPVEVAAAIPQAVKTKYYLTKMVAPLIMAFIPAWLSFWLLAKDHHIKLKDDT